MSTPRPRRVYSVEFKTDAVRMVTELGKPRAQVARELELNEDGHVWEVAYGPPGLNIPNMYSRVVPPTDIRVSLYAFRSTHHEHLRNQRMNCRALELRSGISSIGMPYPLQQLLPTTR